MDNIVIIVIVILVILYGILYLCETNQTQKEHLVSSQSTYTPINFTAGELVNTHSLCDMVDLTRSSLGNRYTLVYRQGNIYSTSYTSTPPQNTPYTAISLCDLGSGKNFLPSRFNQHNRGQLLSNISYPVNDVMPANSKTRWFVKNIDTNVVHLFNIARDGDKFKVTIPLDRGRSLDVIESHQRTV